MLSSRYRPWHVPLFMGKYALLRLRRRPVLLNLEVTMRCNARCGFCDYWKTPAEAKAEELREFADIARRFNPMMITFTGGEPTLRRDLEDIVAAVREATSLSYLAMITHGGMLSLERAQSLWDAGLDQFNISLDYLDGRHDTARGIPGLTAKILDVVPRMKAAGIGSVRFNTVIKNDNLDQLLPLVHTASRLGAGVNFSVYTDAKNGNGDHLLGTEREAELDAVIAELLAYKRRRRGIITNSDHYLSQIPRWVKGQLTEPCPSGTTTVHVDPNGKVRRCPDFPPDVDWTQWTPYESIACDDCFYACRGEAQAPMRWSRVLDVMARPRPS
ncbi:MAG TPA: radical SAM protein [Gemmatimonadaceae bacterium]|nr:radical SAM protein [Gemmatimonadaceae bacterium]